MTFNFNTKKFNFEYTESRIETFVLLESHCHAQFEMIGVLEGDITIILEGKNYRVSKSQVVIIPPLAYHTITANKKGAYRRITTLFDASALPDGIRPFFTNWEAEISIITFLQLERLERICREGDTLLYEPLAQALMTQIFYDVLGASQSSAASEADEFLQSAIGYIEQHLEEKISLDELAKHTSRSRSSFCHTFEEKMKISPKQYILQKKLAFANKLIQDGTPPTAAAVRIGYDNYSNFYRMYFKRYGVSPAKRNSKASKIQ